MAKADRASLEAELAQHFASQRHEHEVASPEVMDELVRAMVAEDERALARRPSRMGTAGFVAAQVRYIPVWTWVTQAVLVAIMFALVHTAGEASATKVAIGIVSAMCVLAGVPTVQASKLSGVIELEYACAHNVASVMVARLIVLGCSSALAIALMVGVTAPAVDASLFDVALWACLPFFLSCAGSLMALRKAHPSAATTLCVAWTAACSTALLALAAMLPSLYASASLLAWLLAAALALAWLAREVALTLRAAAAGLDAFSPQLARTHS